MPPCRRLKNGKYMQYFSVFQSLPGNKIPRCQLLPMESELPLSCFDCPRNSFSSLNTAVGAEAAVSRKQKPPPGYPAVQIDIRLILWQMRDRPKRETRILVQLNKGIRCKTGTRRADPSCCKHGADFLSAKAGHWGNLRRREAAWTISSERVSQKTYKLCV